MVWCTVLLTRGVFVCIVGTGTDNDNDTAVSTCEQQVPWWVRSLGPRAANCVAKARYPSPPKPLAWCMVYPWRETLHMAAAIRSPWVTLAATLISAVAVAAVAVVE